MENEFSSTKNVVSGVPQGSIIGPLLFVLFINDITICLSSGTNIAIYADDTKIWRNICINDDHTVLQNVEQNEFQYRSMQSVVSYAPPPPTIRVLDILPEIEFMYEIDGHILDYCTSEKDLGIHVNPKLNWNEHCTYIVAKANQKFFFAALVIL